MAKKIRILFIEDSENDALLVLREIRRSGFDPIYERVDTVEDMRQALTQREWDVILSDHKMPKFNSTEALAIFKESGRDIPFILVSGSIGEDAAVTAMKTGAHDYLNKDNLKRLVPAIEREMEDAEQRRRRREVESTLAAKESQLRLIADNMSDAIWLMDMNFKYVFVTPSMERSLDYKIEELNAMPLEKIMTPESFSHCQRVIAEELTPKRLNRKGLILSRTLEIEFVRKNGTAFWAEVRYEIIRGADGRPNAILGVGRDITERKRAEELLNQEREFTEKVIESLHDGFLVVDPVGVIVSVNSSLCTMTGFTVEELVGAGLPHPYWPEEEIESIKSAFQKTLAGQFDDIELVFKKKDGRRFPVIRSPSCVTDNRGRVIRYFALIKDITERKQRELKLARSEARYRAVVEDTPLLMCRMLPDCTITFANQAFGRYYGAAPEDFIGLNFLDRVSAEDRDGIKANLASLDIRNSVIDCECRMILSDGQERWQRWIDRAVFEEERLVEYQSIGEDITERKQMEKKLQRQLKELQRWYTVMLDREDRVLELKKEVNDLLVETGRLARYSSS